MKLSAIFVSVNIVAALPVAAQAADEAVSDKAEWLKKNLAALDSTKKPEGRKSSLSDAGVTVSIRGAHLRPFVPNRKLPSRKDLEWQLQAQQARLDDRRLSAQAIVAQQTSPLSGQIAVFGAPPEPNPYGQIPASLSPQKEKVARSGPRPAPRAIPGQTPQLPGQVAFLPGSSASMPFFNPQSQSPPREETLSKPNANLAAPNNFSMSERPASSNLFRGAGELRPGEHIVRQSGALLVQAPVLTPDEQQMADQLLELNRPGRSQQFVDLPGTQMPVVQQQPGAGAPSGADPGPPPFPLNMLPEDALKQLVGRGRPHIDAPPCYFGSWHKAGGLVTSGFHSNICSRRITGKYFGHYAPMAGHGNGFKLGQARRRRIEYAANAGAQPYQTQTVAMYPPYGQ